MWPFGKQKVERSLGAVREGETASVSALLRVVSPNVVVSPVSGLRSALLRVELAERRPRLESDSSQPDQDIFEPVGIAHFGDLLVLRDDEGRELRVLARTCQLRHAYPPTTGIPLTSAPPEIVPLLKGAKGRGLLCVRELSINEGDSLLVTAVVEATRVVVAGHGYRDGTGIRYGVRADLGPVLLEERLT